MAFPTGWTLLGTGTVDNTKVSGSADLTGYPLKLKNLTTQMFANIDDGGGGLRFSADVSGATQLACEIVSCNTGTETSNINVQRTLDYNDDTLFYIWHKTGESQPAVTDTYGRNAVWSRYKAFWHFESDGTDSAGYCDLTGTNSPSFSSGKVGNAVFLNGTSQGLENETANIMRPPTNTPTYYEAYIINDDSGTYDYLMETGYEGSNPAMNDTYWAVAVNALKPVSNTKNDAWISSTNAVTAATWTHIVGSLASGTLTFLKDGAGNGTPAENHTTGTDTTRGWHVGYYGGDAGNSYTNQSFFDGAIDELGVSYDGLTSDWGITRYNNLNDPDTFMSWADADLSGNSYLLKEDGSYLLQETNDKIILEFAPSTASRRLPLLGAGG